MSAKGNILKYGIKDLTVLGYISETLNKAKKLAGVLNIPFQDDLNNLTKCEIVKNRNIVNKEALQEVKNIVKNRVQYIRPYLAWSDTTLEKSIEILLRKPSISKIFLENIKEAKSNHRLKHKFFEYVEYIEGSETRFERSHEKEVLSKNYHGESLAYPLFGSGDQMIEGLIASILKGYQGTIFLIEEPEVHLHPSYIKRLAKVLENMARNESIQMIITTHSPIFVRSLSNKRSIRIVKKRFVKSRFGRNFPATDVVSLSDESINILDIISPELGVPLSYIFFIDVAILVEGRSDMIVYELFIKLLNEQGDALEFTKVNYEFIPFSQLPGKLRILTDVLKKFGVKVFVITDGDEEERQYAQMAEQAGLIPNKEIFVSPKEDVLCYFEPKLICDAIEDMIKKGEIYLKENIMSTLNERLSSIRSKSELNAKILKDVISLIYDNLSEDIKSLYRDKRKFGNWLKAKIAEYIVNNYAKSEVPHDIKNNLEIISGNIREVYIS